MALETELRYFEEHRAELVARNAGKFALIVGSELLGVYDRAEDAYKDGLDQKGNIPMLIKLIAPDEAIGSAPALTLGLLSARI